MQDVGGLVKGVGGFGGARRVRATEAGSQFAETFLCCVRLLSRLWVHSTMAMYGSGHLPDRNASSNDRHHQCSEH